jgi:hypothetical protein
MQNGKNRFEEQPEQPNGAVPPQNRRLVTRRNFLRTGAVVGAGLVATTYVKPDLQSIKVPRAFASASAPPTNGCTPGFWKNHINEWAATGYQTSDSFNSTFGVTAFSPDRTLLDAVQTGGGGADALGRHAVAALLNAVVLGSSNYGLSESQIKTMVQDAFSPGGNIEATKNQFESFNEASCPLGGKLP